MPSFDLEARQSRQAHPDDSPGQRELSLTKHLRDSYDSAQQTWASQFQEDLEYFDGVQFSKAQIEVLRDRGQAALVVNATRPAVNQAVSMLTHNNPSFRATAKEDSDRRVANLWSDVLAHIWHISNGKASAKRAITDYYTGGRGVLYAYIDPYADHGKGEVYMKDLNPTEVYPDPNCKDPYWQDAAHILVDRSMTREQLESLWPDKTDVLDRATPSERLQHPTTDNWALEGQQYPGDIQESWHEQYRVTERYSKIHVQHVHVLNTASGHERVLTPEEYEQYLETPAVTITSQEGEQHITEQEEVGQLLEAIQETGTVYHESVVEVDPQGGPITKVAAGPEENDPYAVPGSTHQLQATNYRALKDAGVIIPTRSKEPRIQVVVTVGEELCDKYVLPISFYPIVPIQPASSRTPYPMSDIRSIRGLQDYLNKMVSLTIAHASSSANVKGLVPQGSINKAETEEEWARPGAVLIEYNAELGKPEIAAPVPMPAELYHLQDRIQGQIERQLGIFSLQQGDASQAPNTYKGTIAVDEFGMRRIRSKLEDIEGALTQMGRVVVQLAQATYTEEKIIRLFQPNGETKEVALNQPVYDEYSGELIGRVMDVTVGEYDIIVAAGSTLPSNRWAMLEMYMDLYREGVIDQVEVLKKTDVVDVEGVLNRFGQMSQMAETIEGLQEQLKNLEGQLQTKSREVINANEKVQLEKFKSQLKNEELTVEKATQLFQERIGDLLQMEKQKRTESKGSGN